MSTISERVQRGAAWLDTERPGWFDRIDLDTLRLTSDCNCVLGQEFGSYGLTRTKLPATAQQMGFNARIDPGYAYTSAQAAEYLELLSEWRRVITERRAAA